MSGFRFRKSLDGNTKPVLMSGYGKNLIAFTVGELVRINTSGFVDISDSGEEIIGVCMGVTDKNGLPVDPDTGYTDKWTMGGSNQTVDFKKVQFIPALPQYLFYNDSDGSLTIANLMMYADVASSVQVTTGGFTDTATAQVRLIEIDPDGDGDASKGLFQIVESQLQTIGKGNNA